jgi:N-ethylmaleimide reductase
MTETLPLLTPIAIGDLNLPNRIVMASMTRGRTTGAEHVPNAMNVEYYRQRASAGLILTEGTWPSADGIGYINVPGIFTAAQAEGWRLVTDAVHDAGGRMFVQLGHTGTAAHPDHRDGKLPAGPSPVNPMQRVFTPEGFKETLTPSELTISEIQQIVADYAHAAHLAKSAGFDGVEVHGSSAYIIPQFLNDRLNVRTDAYGGSPEKRARFLFEILEAIIAEWGTDRVGLKLSPLVHNMGGFVATESTQQTFEHVITRLNDYPVAYLQVTNTAGDYANTPVAWLAGHLFSHTRSLYAGRIMANGGFTFESGNAIVASGDADLVSYALPFIANPDLVDRFANGHALSEPNRTTFYAGGAMGYIDYPH